MARFGLTDRFIGMTTVLVVTFGTTVAHAQADRRNRTSKGTSAARSAPSSRETSRAPASRVSPGRSSNVQKTPDRRGPSSASRSPSRAAPVPPRSQPTVAGRTYDPPNVSRQPLVRAPSSVADDMPRVKDRGTVFPTPSSRDEGRVNPSYSAYSPNRDRLVDRDRVSGLIRIGADPFNVHIGDRPYDHGRRYHYRPFGSSYRPCDYYNRYRPMYYPGFRPYSPYFGYAYSSVYFTQPALVQVYDDSVGYTTTGYADTTYAQPTPQPAAAYAPAPQDASVPYAAPTAASMPQAVSEGNAAFAAGRFDEARRLYVQAVMADERDGYAKVLYAWSNFAVGDYAVAAAAIRRALLTTSDLIDYPMDLRTLYSDAGLLQAQKEALQRHALDRPDDREAQLVLGYLYYSIGEADRAASLLNGLTDREPGDSTVALLRDAAVRAARGQTPPPP